MKIRYATLSKTGNRDNNEDAFRVIDHREKERWFGIVCDGMGGYKNGEVASNTVVNAISDYWEAHDEDCDSPYKVMEACHMATVAIDEKFEELGKVKMGTTMVMASICGDIVTIAHLGDSRCYLQRVGEGFIYQTPDQMEVKFGYETVAKFFFPYRHDIVKPEVRTFKIKKGDRILICSDGIYKSIMPCALKERMMDNKTPDEVLSTFEFLYNTYGNDNYTAILACIE